ncbi:MAG: response regulator [Candidatus Methanoperedens sp.]
MKILVVEDDPNHMMLMKIILQYYGHDSIEAFTGAEGIEKTFNSRPDIVLMNLKLPGIDGFEAARKIREVMKDIPIIAITSYSMEDVREKINKSGFNGLIQKPINPGTIMDEIKNFIFL